MTSMLIVSDAWYPQINGVVRTMQHIIDELSTRGVRFSLLTPAEFATLPCPTYPEIRLALTRPGTVRKRVVDAAAEHIHIATEGPLGMMAMRAARALGRPVTTSYHTRFPEYLSARAPVPQEWSYAVLRRFHNTGHGCMVATETLERDLANYGFRNLMRWSRGVDHTLFRPFETSILPPDLPRPIFMTVGRIAVEKNVRAFLDLDLPGSKVVVGDGPDLERLRADYQHVLFTGAKSGDDLAHHFASADVFVFPSLTDTFGNVVLEALACGTPVAAFPVMGPKDIIAGTHVGVLDADLRAAALAALRIPRMDCRAYALKFSWNASAEAFLANAETVREAYYAEA